MNDLYDLIGQGYRARRRPDPRIQRRVFHALGHAETIINVGAGTGSYEPPAKRVVAVEPSRTMIEQRSKDAAPVVQASAVALPFADHAFDGAVAILTIHHWPDWRRGVQELARVARHRVVMLTWDPMAAGFWLVEDYLPEIATHDRRIFPTLNELADELGRVTITTVPIPHDCTDGFLGAFWRRPHEYLRPSVRAGMSTFARLKSSADGLERLRQDLISGRWQRRHHTLLSTDELDLGYRLIAWSAP